MSDFIPHIFEFEGLFYLSNVQQAYQTLEALCAENKIYLKRTKKVVFVRETPLRLLKLPNAEKLNDHDTLLALSYECASLLNLSSEEIALSIIRHDEHATYPTDFFLSTFERHLLVERVRVLQKFHLKCVHFFSLDQALFLSHFQQPSTQHSVMFLLLEQRMIAILPQENDNYHVRNLNMGAQDLKSNPTQFAAQVKRRLSIDEHQDIVMYAPNALLALQEQIQSLLQLNTFKAIALESILDTLSKNEFEKQICASSVEVATEPKPFRTLALLLCVVLLVFGGLFANYLMKFNRNMSLKEELSLRQRLNQDMMSKQAQIDQQRKMLSDFEKQRMFFQHHAPFSNVFYSVVQLLSRYRLFHSRIVSVSLDGDVVVILGESQDQADFTKFITHFQAQLQKENLRLHMQEFVSTADANLKTRAQMQLKTQSSDDRQDYFRPTTPRQSFQSDAQWQFKCSISKETAQ